MSSTTSCHRPARFFPGQPSSLSGRSAHSRAHDRISPAFPLAVAGFVVLWRRPELRFLAVACTLIVAYVLAWVPGKAYYSFGIAPELLAAGSVAAERWIARARWPRLRTTAVAAAPLVGLALMPVYLPVVPVTDVHSLPSSAQHLSNVGDTVDWP